MNANINETIKQLKELNNAELVAWFNKFAGAEVKRFASREQGLKRCLDALQKNQVLAENKKAGVPTANGAHEVPPVEHKTGSESCAAKF